jgi:Transcription initiation factor IIA, gamma subunit
MPARDSLPDVAVMSLIGSWRDVQGSLKSYNHYDNVWRFDVKNATLKLTAKAQGALTSAPKLTTDKIKVICVDAKLCSGPNP